MNHALASLSRCCWILAWLMGAALGAADEKIMLWTGPAPVGDGTTEANATTSLTIHRPAHANGSAIVICPGGGYGGLMMGPEGNGIADWLATNGITGAVLEYRLPKGRSNVPLLDAQRALRLLRAQAKEFSLDPRRIGIIGFSAGGHLAASAGTMFDAGDAKSKDPIEQQSSRPDFVLLIYPVVSMTDGVTHGFTRDNLLGQWAKPEAIAKWSPEQHVTANTPPMFLAHAIDDNMVTIENSRLLYKALQKAQVPSQLLELPNGGHGLNGYSGPSWEAWKTASLTWMAALKPAPKTKAKAK